MGLFLFCTFLFIALAIFAWSACHSSGTLFFILTHTHTHTPVEGNGHFFPSYRQLYLSSFSDTHTHTHAHTHPFSKCLRHWLSCFVQTYSICAIHAQISSSFTNWPGHMGTFSVRKLDNHHRVKDINHQVIRIMMTSKSTWRACFQWQGISVLQTVHDCFSFC